MGYLKCGVEFRLSRLLGKPEMTKCYFNLFFIFSTAHSMKLEIGMSSQVECCFFSSGFEFVLFMTLRSNTMAIVVIDIMRAPPSTRMCQSKVFAMVTGALLKYTAWVKRSVILVKNIFRMLTRLYITQIPTKITKYSLRSLLVKE